MAKRHIEDFIEEMQSALESKKLLDSILSYYQIYTGQFDKIPEYDAEYMMRRNDGTYITDSLNKRIREYLNFDDSE